MNRTENDLRALLFDEAADIDQVPSLSLPTRSRRPYLAAAAGVAVVVAVAGFGLAVARHESDGHGAKAAAGPSSNLGADPKAGIGPAGTACIRTASSIAPIDIAKLPAGTATYPGVVGEPITVTTASPDPQGRVLTSILMSATGPGTTTGDCALAVTSKPVASGHIQAGTRVSFTFTPWQPGNYTIGLQTEPGTAYTATSTPPPTPSANPDVMVLGALVAVVEVR